MSSATQGDGPFVLIIRVQLHIMERVMCMARTARKQSNSGIYHVMLRAVNRQQIFLDEEDARSFLYVLRKCMEISTFRLFAYCLMGNHVHLLLQIGEEPLSQVMKRIGTRYVVWYNTKYDRTGHLFQDRYKSEPVQDNAYFLTALRYILNNPVKAGICSNAEDYPLSSAKDYCKGGGITDTSFAIDLVGRENLLEYLRTPSDDTCMDDDSQRRISDKAAQEIIIKTVGGPDLASCLKTIAGQPNSYVNKLRAAGLSIRQISRLTGLSIAIVRK